MRYSPRAIARYQPEKILSTNNDSQVLLCFDTVLKTKVVLKILSNQDTHEPEITKQFSDKQNSVTVLDIIDDVKAKVIVLEYVKQGALFDYVVEKDVDILLAIRLIAPILRIVEELHSLKYVHRDIKLENILLDGDQTILTDYEYTMKVTKELMVSGCGSPHYASPEVIFHEKHDLYKSDIYSIGIVFYAILFRKLPYVFESYDDLMHQIVQDMPFPKKAHPVLKSIIQEMTNKKADLRPNLRNVWKKLYELYVAESIETYGDSYGLLKLHLL